MSPALAGRPFTTETPGKTIPWVFNQQKRQSSRSEIPQRGLALHALIHLHLHSAHVFKVLLCAESCARDRVSWMAGVVLSLFRLMSGLRQSLPKVCSQDSIGLRSDMWLGTAA